MSLIKKAGALADSMGLPAYLVGGMVRDALMGLYSKKDIDITVEGDGLAFARTLADDLGASYKGFEKFRTARIFLKGGQRIDVASARSEEYPEPGMLPIVELAAINQDLYRRDFTINAMGVRINRAQFGELLDPFNGQEDLKNRTLRVLYDRSFIDDPTRLLRFIRFQSRFGLKPEVNTMELFNADISAGVFEAVSGERIREELVLIMKEKNICEALRMLCESGASKALGHGIRCSTAINAAFLRADAMEEEIRARRVDPALIKMALFLSITPVKEAAEFIERYKFSNEWKEAVLQSRKAASLAGKLRKKLAPGQAHKLLKDFGPEALLFLKILLAGKAAADNVDNYIKAIDRVKVSTTGKDLIKMGIKPGGEMGRILDRLMEAKLDGKVTSKFDESQYVKNHMKKL